MNDFHEALKKALISDDESENALMEELEFEDLPNDIIEKATRQIIES